MASYTLFVDHDGGLTTVSCPVSRLIPGDTLDVVIRDFYIDDPANYGEDEIFMTADGSQYVGGLQFTLAVGERKLPVVERAIRQEYRNLERLISETDPRYAPGSAEVAAWSCAQQCLENVVREAGLTVDLESLKKH